MPAAPAIIAAVGAVGGALISKKVSENAAQAQKEAAQASIDAQKEANKLDPRIEAMLYGTGETRTLKAGAVPKKQIVSMPFGGEIEKDVYAPEDYEVTNDTGLLGRLIDYSKSPQSTALQSIGQAAEAALLNNYASDQALQRAAAMKAISGYDAPQMQAAIGGGAAFANLPEPMKAAIIKAPNQNEIELKDAFSKYIFSESGNNPYLTGAIQKGINQSKNAFEELQNYTTRNLTENILGNIRGGAIAAGQYGGSRQGLAESGAVRDHTAQMARALSQFGQNNTDAAVAAQASAYNQDQANKLAALQSLSGQQYSTAAQNAQAEQAANLTNYQGALQNAQFNAGLKNQYALANLGNAQSAGQANLNARLATNQLNSGNLFSGLGALGGLSASNYNLANQADTNEFSKLQQTLGLLQPYANRNTPINVPQYQPVYSNPLGGAIGGATTAMGLYNMFRAPNTTNTGSIGNWGMKEY